MSSGIIVALQSRGTPAMRIGELSKSLGVEEDTIRYYEKIGLLHKPGREANGYRSYGRAHVERVAFIRHCRALDIPLAEIKRLLEYVAQPTADCSEVNQIVDAQLSRVRARVKSMRALEKQLLVLRTQCSSPHTATDCGILHELVSAAQGEACACHPSPSPHS